jgi:hypothetical protein
MLGLAVRPVHGGHDTEEALPDLETEGYTHAHLNDFAREFGGKISGLRAKGDTTAMLDWTAEVSRSGDTTALLVEGLPAGSTAFAAGLCVGRSLAQRVAVVGYTEMEDITTNGMVEDGWVEKDDVGFVRGVCLCAFKGSCESEINRRGDWGC